MPVAATTFKPTPIPKELRKKVRDSLRAARDIMNENGLHWMQGEYKMPLLVPTGKTDIHGEPIMQNAKDAFTWCAVGGIREVATIHGVEDACIVALAERGGLPDKNVRLLRAHYENRLDRLQSDWYYYEQGGRDVVAFPDSTDDLSLAMKADEALDIVTGWNDANGRTWEQVKAAFTKAAASIK